MWDFPNSPAVGAAFTPAPGSPTYTWNGSVWLQGSPGSILTARRGNRAVNGNVAISQENGVGTVTAAGGYMADQWRMNFSGLTPQAALSSTGTITPDHNIYRINLNFSVAKGSLAATDNCYISTQLEGLQTSDFGWGTANAIPAVARFSASCGVPGNYTFHIRGGSTYSFTKLIALTATMQTFVIPIPALTVGPAWAVDNTVGANIGLTAACGTSNTSTTDNAWASGNFIASPGQANLAATTGQNISISDFGLYADPDNTGLPPPWEVPDYATELVRCQRYFSSGNSFLVGSYGANGQIVYTDIPHKVLMRGTPAVTIVGAPTYSNASAMSSNGATPNMARLQVTVAAAGYGYGFSGNLTLNARM
jgi:hypothetical protein